MPAPWPWTGARNYQARNFMRDAMRIGMACSSITVLPRARHQLAWLKWPAPRTGRCTQFDPKSKYFDPKSSPESPRWLHVDVRWRQTTGCCRSPNCARGARAGASLRILQRGNRLRSRPSHPPGGQLS